MLINGTYYLFVSEMVDGCGLSYWVHNSRVVTATSKTLLGPYKFTTEALGVWAHNPFIAIDNSTGTPTYLVVK